MSSDDSLEVDAFLLLTLPDCTIRTPTATQTGILELQCVTLPQSAQADFDRDVFLVFRINDLEIPIDPTRTVSLNANSNEREYIFHGTETDPFGVFTLSFSESLYSAGLLVEDIGTFESVLSQYVNFTGPRPHTLPTTPTHAENSSPLKNEDFCGRLVLRDQDSGELVGEFDNKIIVKDDPILYQTGHENDPVVIEIPQDASLDPNRETAIEVFARSVPANEHDWMMKSAVLISHAITGTTNLIVRVISPASSHHISRSTPLISAQSSANPLTSTFLPPPTLPPPPSRTAAFLNSDRTRKVLTKVHAVSARAVKITSMAKPLVDNVVYHMAGVGKGQAFQHTPPQQSYPLSLDGPGPGSSSLTTLALPPPPPHFAGGLGYAQQIPRVRHGLPFFSNDRLGTRARIVLSADLILSTMEESAKKIVTVGAERADATIRHKYGPEVASSSAAMTGAARNVALVYIDLQGIARRAVMMRVSMKNSIPFTGRF
ncbi:hypothetical protein L218DRAFT_121278 [Marasmius fiardii PR-910]|nr:hypothetical protein L218DRAFT_121278 [Marasmius fiardii PR-910]